MSKVIIPQRHVGSGMLRVRRPREYLEELWFLMQHSDNRNRKCIVLDCYVDDSGTHEQSEIVVLGGLVLDRDNFIRFDKKWRPMLHRYRIESLHMADFVRPHGKHIGMLPELKVSLFTEAVSIINTRKAVSISVAVNHAPYKEAVPVPIYRKAVSPYVSAFLYLARLNAATAEQRNYPDRIAYLVDETRSFAEQIRRGHALCKAWEATHGSKIVRTGALAFDSDENVSALQAADLIAWSARRKFSGDELTAEFSPLNEVLLERFGRSGAVVRTHCHRWVKDDIGPRMMEDVKANGPQRLREAMENLKALAESEGGI